MFDFLKTKKTYQNATAMTFYHLMNENPDAVILDVRTSGEYHQEALEGAVNIDIMGADFVQKVSNLDKDKTYLVYCRSGNRSGSACQIMTEAGFEKVYNLAGGIMSWPY